jgi:protein-S-isoprenylcysteine O-methyltransferase Ste14
MRSERRLSAPFVVDWFERLVITGVFTYLVISRHEQLNDPGSRTWLILYIVSEGLVVVFVLIRRHTQDVTLRPSDWLIAIAATALPLLARPSGSSPVPTVIGLLFVVTGIIFQISSKLTLRRSFGLIAANRGVKVGGPYALVRHPMYAGYLFSHIGLLLLSPIWFNLLLYCAAWTAQILRIMAEERLLLGDQRYVDYSAKVRYRLIPGAF